MPSNKDTKKKLPEILDKFASNSEKATKQLGEMSSQLSAFVDMLSENVQKESRRKDTEDRRRKKARAVRAQRDAADELQKTQNEYAEAAKGLAQLDKDELKKSKQKAKQKESDKLKEQQKERQEKIGKLKEKGTPYSDIANKNFSSGNILGGLFASIFAIKDVSNKRKLSSLEKDEKEYNEQEEDRNNQEKEDQEKETESDLKQKRLEAKKKLQESVTKLQGSVQPAASVSPSKIANPEDQVIAETVKLNDEDKVKQSQEQTKKLGTLDDNISRIWTDHLQVTVADISDPAIDKLKGIFSGLETSQNKSGEKLSEILGFSKFLPEIMPALTTLGTTYLAPLLIPLAAIAIAAAVWKGLAWLLNKDAEEAQARGLKEQADRLAADKAKTSRESQIATNTVRDESATAIKAYGAEAATPEYAEFLAKEAEKTGDKTLAAAWYEEGRRRKTAAPGAAAPTPEEAPAAAAPTPAAAAAPTPAAAAPTPAAAAPTPKPTAVVTKPNAKDRINLVANKARKVEQTTGGLLPKELLMTQYMLESGRGKSETAFGLKATNSYIEKGGKVDTRATWEEFTQDQINDQTQKGYKVLDTPTPTGRKNAKGQDIFKVRLEQPFVGGGLENQIDEYVKLMTGQRYGKALNTYKVDHDLPMLFKNIKDAGYATDSEYTAKLTKMQPEITKLFSEPGSSTPQLLASTPQTGVNVVAAMKNKAETDRGNTVTIAPITTNNVVSGAKSGDGLPYRDARDYIRKAVNPDVFGIVTRSSAG